MFFLMMRTISPDLRAPAKPIANIKQVPISRKEAFGVLYFVKIKSTSSFSIGFSTFVGLKTQQSLRRFDSLSYKRVVCSRKRNTGQLASPPYAVQGSCNRCTNLTRINFIPNKNILLSCAQRLDSVLARGFWN